MHLPLREPRLLGSLRTGWTLAAIVAAWRFPPACSQAAIAGDSHAAIYAVVLASARPRFCCRRCRRPAWTATRRFR